MTRTSLQKKRDKTLLQILPHTQDYGWSYTAVMVAGISRVEFKAIFPGGLEELADYFATYFNHVMLSELATLDPDTLRIRDRVKVACLTRLRAMEPYKPAVKSLAAFGAGPFRALETNKRIWNVADTIWNWAGDTATDYNYYSKRLLLSGVIVSTTLYWLNISENNPDLPATEAFLDRRIENVMQLNKIKPDGLLKKIGLK